MTHLVNALIEVKIRYSHKQASHEYVYNVYARHKLIGTLTQGFDKKSYIFQSNKAVALSVTSQRFETLGDACEELPDLIPSWICLAALNGVK